MCVTDPKGKEVIAVAFEFLGNGQELKLRPLGSQSTLLLMHLHQCHLKVNRLREGGREGRGRGGERGRGGRGGRKGRGRGGGEGRGGRGEREGRKGREGVGEEWENAAGLFLISIPCQSGIAQLMPVA